MIVERVYRDTESEADREAQRQALRLLIAAASADGYREDRGDDLEREYAAESRCPDCGHTGLAYASVSRHGSRRAFLACGCGRGEEI